jgi:heme/copper-type cytochrome/quinol oxidase subunit 3
MSMIRAPLITSPWPLYSSIGILALVNSVVEYLWSNVVSDICLCLAYSALNAYGWLNSVSREGSVGFISIFIQDSIKLGMALFMLSEVLFFIAFFWIFFHRSSSGVAWSSGSRWPPSGIEVIDPIAYPLLNTVILLRRGCTATWAHAVTGRGLYCGSEKVYIAYIWTLLLGLYFIALQATEYIASSFSSSDSIYGSTFYVGTGFHGLHVIAGIIVLISIGCKRWSSCCMPHNIHSRSPPRGKYRPYE